MGRTMSKAPAKRKATTGVKISGTERKQEVRLSCEDALEKLFGTDNPAMANALMVHCIKVLKGDEASDEHPGNDERPFMLAAVAEIKPRDTVERMLAVQMAATHVAMIRIGGMFARADQLPQFEAHERAYNKLARTFTAQVEALRKHRNGGRQTVVVQHVNVADGGQAIVGHVETGGGSNGK